MRAFPWCLALILSVSLLPMQAEAARKKTSHKKESAPAVVSAVQAPADFADAFHQAMHARNRVQLLDMLAPDLVVFETGYMEATRDEYVKSNLDDDIDFASATEYRPMSRGVIGSGEHMTVLTKARIRGTFGDQRVDLDQTETMILRRTKTAWEIVHLHWSAHPRQTNDSEPQARLAPPAPQAEPAPSQASAEPAQTTLPDEPVERAPPAILKESTELTVPARTVAKPQ